MRLLLVFLFLTAFVLISFILWEDTLMRMFSEDASVSWLRQFGAWAWLPAIGLLMADLVLPLPATILMSAVGYIYGFAVGFFVSFTGSFASGSLGYSLCRNFGEKATLRILGARDFERGKSIFQNAGVWIVILSRWLPVFPEVVSCMAGLTRMDPMKFHLALLTGTVPLAMIYTYIGYSGVEQPTVALLLSAGLPPLIWLIASQLIRRLSSRPR